MPKVIRRVFVIVAAVCMGAGIALATRSLIGGGRLTGLPLVIVMFAAAAALGTAVMQFAFPRTASHDVLLRGGTTLVAAALTATAAGLLAERDGTAQAVWTAVVGAAVATAAVNAVAYVRAGGNRGGAGEPRVEPGEVPLDVNPETVEVVLGATKELLVGEDGRAQSLHTRATGLAGFSAIVVALLLPVTRSLGKEATDSVPVAATILLGAAAALLMTSVLAVLLGVVITQQVTTISIEEVGLWETAEFVSKSPTWARGRLLVTLRGALVSQRRANNRKAAWLTGSVVLIAAATLCAAAGGFTLLA